LLVDPTELIGFTESNSSIAKLLNLQHEIAALDMAQNLLDWNLSTSAPKGATEIHAFHYAAFEGMMHQRWASKEMGTLLQKLGKQMQKKPFTNTDRGLVRQATRLHEQATKLPRNLVEEVSRVRVISQQAWAEAKVNNDFATFAPHLARTVSLKREVADYYGGENRYDPLLDYFEQGMTVRELDRLFIPIREASPALLQRIKASNVEIESGFLTGEFEHSRQKSLVEQLLTYIGYDFNRGQLSVGAHPITVWVASPQDVRVSTRYGKYLPGSVMAGLHEGGHGMYEQGLAPALMRTRLARGVSLGMHESQSRLWENSIGRSLSFWKSQYHLVQETFPIFQEISVESFVSALNVVKPGVHRVEADEVSYNLHILVRYELERALIEGELSVESLPRVWGEKYMEYLGVEPGNDTDGVLQDIHWSSGYFGYFPTYTLGNLYAAQIYHSLRQQFPDFAERLTEGTGFIRQWLLEHLYRFGSIYEPDELMVYITGEPTNPTYLIDYLNSKFSQLYDL